MARYHSPSHSHDYADRHGHVDDGYADDGGFADNHSYVDDELMDPDTVSVNVLVDHLLAARSQLSSCQIVWRADDLTQNARQLFEDSLILEARTAFLMRGVLDEVSLLKRVQHGMLRTSETSRKELFNRLIPRMDRTEAALAATMDKLKRIAVDPVFRPPEEEEEPKHLFDFVSEDQVQVMKTDLIDGINQMDGGRKEFDEQLKKFAREMDDLNETISSASTSPADPPHDLDHYDPDLETPEDASILELVTSMEHHAHGMAKELSELSRHYDTCQRAVRLTNGAADLAQARDVEDGSAPDPMLLEYHDDLETLTRAQAVTRVIIDANEIPFVVSAVHDRMQDVESDYRVLKAQSDRIRAAHEGVVRAVERLQVIRRNVEGYHNAANHFVEQSNAEKRVILDTLDGMEQLREHWERYMESYDSLRLEVERRRAVEEKIESIWRKAKDQVDKLIDKDWADREAFTEKVGEFIPVDLWVRMSGPLQKWDVVLAQLDTNTASVGRAASGEMPKQEDDSAAVLSSGLEHGALERTGTSSGSQR